VKTKPSTKVELTVNGEALVAEKPLTLAQLLRRLERDPRRIAVEVNGQLVPRDDHASRHLQSGDVIEIVGFVGGG